MRISSSLLARQPTELLRYRNGELRTQTITTHKSACRKLGAVHAGFACAGLDLTATLARMPSPIVLKS
jgi:acyl-coenzyme A thioesterase PaaI-like protein